MHSVFLSVVTIIHQREDVDLLTLQLTQLCALLHNHFAHFEIIVVNNIPEYKADEIAELLQPHCRQHIYLLQLSSRVNHNHAYLAGLDRSNGDYTLLWESIFADQPERILELYEQATTGYDIVYLRGPGRKTGPFQRLLYRLFYFIMQHYSALRVDPRAHNSRIISRRALNSLLRLRENLHYMKAIYSIVGYRTARQDTPVPLPSTEGLRERFRTSLMAITSYTTFLRSVLLWLFLFSAAFLLFVVVNALKVKFTGIDLLGQVGEAWSGWTFLVILIAVFFAVTCLNLYIMSIYLSNIYSEIKQRPLYIIESIRRF
jgi:glycosyltransferase involved in cell wall biosynthesis